MISRHFQLIMEHVENESQSVHPKNTLLASFHRAETHAYMSNLPHLELSRHGACPSWPFSRLLSDGASSQDFITSLDMYMDVCAVVPHHAEAQSWSLPQKHTQTLLHIDGTYVRILAVFPRWRTPLPPILICLHPSAIVWRTKMSPQPHNY